MGQIDNLVEGWIESNKLPFGYEGVEGITKKLQSYIEVCDTQPIEDKIKALSFLYDKCDYILSSIASFMNYQLEYEPTDDEIWNFIEEQRKNTNVHDKDLPYWKYYISDENIGDPECIDESTLYEHIIHPMREQYREKNKEASEWCDKIEDIQTNIYIKISKEKEKQMFLKEVFESSKEMVKTSFDELLTGICPNKEKLKIRLKSILNGKKGRSVAITLIALDKINYINLNKLDETVIFRILQSEFGVTGRRNTLNTALNKAKGNEKDLKYMKAIDKDVEILKQ